MVDNTVFSLYQDLPPTDGEGRKIKGGPLYSAEQIISATKAYLWTRKSERDIANLGMDNNELLELVKDSVRNGRYRDSEWCMQSPAGKWVACDSYSYLHSHWSDDSCRNVSYEYFIKFCIGKMGALLLVVSCHLSS